MSATARLLLLAATASAHVVRPLGARPGLAWRAAPRARMRLDLGSEGTQPPPLLFAVTLPEGFRAGDTLTIQAPSGMQCHVVVPAGVAPGQVFQVQLPGAAAEPAPAPLALRPAAFTPEVEASSGLLDTIIMPESNPYRTSKAERARAKWGDEAGFVDLRNEREQGRLEQLERDLNAFKAERGLSGRALAGGAADDPLTGGEEPGLLQKVINALGNVLTFNFFVIIIFFSWFLTGSRRTSAPARNPHLLRGARVPSPARGVGHHGGGRASTDVVSSLATRGLSGVGLQYGAHDKSLINAFRSAWDVLILPLLSTHMALTFLSAGLERLSKSDA